jgi:uncharacterized protein (TIGR03435 family)
MRHLVLAKIGREQRDFSVYGLVVGKGGLKMKESADSDVPGTASPGAASVAAVSRTNGVTVNYSNGSTFTFADNQFAGHKLSATMMADVMALHGSSGSGHPAASAPAILPEIRWPMRWRNWG